MRWSAATPERPVAEYTLYILRCADGSLYTGIARDVTARLEEHRNGKRGAKYLRGRAPFRLVFEHPAGNRGAAQRLEFHVKRLPRSTRLDLAAGRVSLDEALPDQVSGAA